MVRNRLTVLAGMLFVAVAIISSQAFAEVKTLSLAEVEAMVAKTPSEGNYLLVDARPEIKYFEGHIAWAKSLPWQEMNERLDELPAEKGMKLVFYCGGLKCDLSGKAAALAEEVGYTDVSIFAEGMPGWQKGGHSPWVASNYVKMVLNDRDRVALIVDARPFIKYNEGTIPGALNIPFQEWEKLQGLLPSDKKTQLIFFCGGIKCDLSHKSAAKAMELGYSDVRTYAYGWPDWKKSSTRAFAMVNPKDGGGAASAAPEAVVYDGEISKDELVRLIEEKPEGFLLVDVRPAEEYEKAHLPGAINILDETVSENLDRIKVARNVVFYCNTGSRCAAAYYAAEDAGFKGTRFLNREVAFDAGGGYEIK